jgi:hypothetical protein
MGTGTNHHISSGIPPNPQRHSLEESQRDRRRGARLPAVAHGPEGAFAGGEIYYSARWNPGDVEVGNVCAAAALFICEQGSQNGMNSAR